jgi:phytoene desaturase
LERDGGVWFAMGGTNKLVSGLVAHFERIGGRIRLSDPVEAIETEDGSVTAVRTRSGWSQSFDAVASNADVVRTYDMLGHARGPKAARKLRRKRFSPSLFVVHFGTEGEWPDVPHHNIVFGPRYEGAGERHLSRRRAAGRSGFVPSPSDRDRSRYGAAGLLDLLRTGAGAASRQICRRLGQRRHSLS